MNTPLNIINSKNILRLLIGTSILIFLLACRIQLPGSGTDQGMEQTQQAVSVQQTMLAQQSEQQMQGTLQAQQATIAAQSALATSQAQSNEPAVDVVATQVAQSSQSTQQTQPKQSPPPSTTNGGEIPDNFDEMMKSANILLFEDIVNYPSLYRYVKTALDNMGLNYKDDGSAKGWFKSGILANAPDGEPWDLIIMAAESKSAMSGEYLEYLNQALNRGSAMIIETWYLDSVASGKASLISTRCGFTYQKDWSDVPPSKMAMFPLDPADPILHRPNDGISFTDVTDVWAYGYDIGDFIKLNGKGDAKLIVGTIATDKNKNGTVVVCLDRKLIWQNFSSHQLTYDSMVPVWENYIYNALAAKLLGD
jgi:hypothetical protein